MSEATIENTPVRGQSIKGERALDSLDFRARTTGQDAAARSQMVRRLRIALPTVAVILILAFIFSTKSNTVDQAFLDDFKSLNASTKELRTTNPSFSGVDDEGKPFEITAIAASQDPDAKDVIRLEKPRAVQGEGEEASVVTAEGGLFRSEENILTLNRSVTFEHQIGANTYVLRSPTATVLIKDQIVTSDAGVDGEGPDGATLQADRMRAHRDDGRVVFEGNVSMRIYPNKEKAPLPSLRDGTANNTENGENEQ